MSGPAGECPDRGHLVWMSLDPTAGHEQAGRRPALVLSAADYNGRTGLAVVCPVTSRAKGYPFEVQLPDGLPVSGVVLADQARSVDWVARGAVFGGGGPPGGGGGGVAAVVAAGRHRGGGTGTGLEPVPRSVAARRSAAGSAVGATFAEA